MIRPLSALLLLLLAGCAPGKGTVLVTVTAGAPVTNIDHLRITVVATGLTSKPAEVKVPNAPATIPPAQMLALTFNPAQRGRVALTIEALDAAQKVLASGTSPAEITVSEQTMVTVTLGGPGMSPGDGGAPDLVTSGDMPPSGDMAGSDMAMSGDMATPDIAMPADTAMPADIAMPADLAAPADMSMPADLAMPPDLSDEDLS